MNRSSTPLWRWVLRLIIPLIVLAPSWGLLSFFNGVLLFLILTTAQVLAVLPFSSSSSTSTQSEYTPQELFAQDKFSMLELEQEIERQLRAGKDGAQPVKLTLSLKETGKRVKIVTLEEVGYGFHPWGRCPGCSEKQGTPHHDNCLVGYPRKEISNYDEIIPNWALRYTAPKATVTDNTFEDSSIPVSDQVFNRDGLPYVRPSTDRVYDLVRQATELAAAQTPQGYVVPQPAIDYELKKLQFKTEYCYWVRCTECGSGFAEKWHPAWERLECFKCGSKKLSITRSS